jgi:hypothetical protein
MSTFNCGVPSTIAVLVILCSAETFGQKMDVKVIKRQSSETGYNYVVPGQFNSSSETNLNCDADSTDANCSGKTTTNGTISVPKEISYSVTGATLSLQLPDGRVVIVNCTSKENMNMAERQQDIYRRSCRTPLVDEIQAEFKGKTAKLFWPASIDGKKFESETYKILAVLSK